MCIGGQLYGRCNGPAGEKANAVPLAGVEVRGKLTDFVSEVELFHRFVNIEDHPLKLRASVSRFYAIVGGMKFEGKIKDKEQANNDYDDAIASGHTAYMLEEGNKENQFKTSIGNLPPKEEVMIAIVFISELNFRDGQLEFVLPTNTKAYPDGTENQNFWTPQNEMIIKPVIAPLVPSYGLKLDIHIAMTSTITNVSSPSHPINYVAGEGNNGIISLANQNDVGSPLLTHFELLLSLSEPSKPVFRVQGNVAMLALYPNFHIEKGEEPITEMIFLVDRSGSMQGSKINRVRDTLQIFLRRLPLATFFNIIGFGTTFVSLFAEGSKQYDDATLHEATKHVNEIQANLQGTYLLPPLKHILSSPLRERIPRQVFLLTDGEVTNAQECINYVRQHSNVSRFFTFGIEGASPALVTGIAKAGEGRVELISGNTDIGVKVMSQLKRALQPALTNIQINWEGIVQEQTPLKIPPLFNGSRLITYGHLNPNAAPGTIKLTAQSVKGDHTLEVAVSEEDLKPNSDLDFIPRLAARSMIRDLEDIHIAEGNQISTDAKNKIIDLSIKSGMLSKYTAFIAVNKNDKPVEGSMQRRTVVLDESRKLRRSRSGSRARCSFIIPITNNLSLELDREKEKASGNRPKATSKRNADQLDQSEMNRDRERSRDRDRDRAREQYHVLRTSEAQSSFSPTKSVLPPSPSERTKTYTYTSTSYSPSSVVDLRSSSVRNIVIHQKASGNFVEEVLTTLGTTIVKLGEKAPQEIKSLPRALLDQVCGILRSKYMGDVGQWELVDKKAISWVKKEVNNASSSSSSSSSFSSDSLSSFDWTCLAVALANSL